CPRSREWGAGPHPRLREPHRKPKPIDDRQRIERQDRHRRIELTDLVVDEPGGAGWMPLQHLAEAELLDERDGEAVGLEQVVVELLEPDSRRDLEAAGQP